MVPASPRRRLPRRSEKLLRLAVEQLEPRVLLSGWNLLTMEYGDSTGEAGRYSSVAVNGNDAVCVTYLNTFQLADWDPDLEIGVRQYTTGSGWSSGGGSRVLQTGVEGLFTSVAFDADDTPHVSYYDQTNGNLMYNRGFSSNASTVDSTGDVGQYSSLAVDSLGQAHIVYYDKTNGQLKYAFNSNASGWVTTTLVTVGDVSETGTPNVHRLASLAVDKSNHPHVSYFDPASQSLRYMQWTGAAWTTPVTVDAGGGSAWLGVDNALKLDRQDHPHIAYYAAGDADLRYAAWNGAAWTIQTLDSTGDVGRFASLSLDGAGNPHIAYTDATNRRVKYTYWDASAWQTSTIDTDEYSQIQYVSCALDKVGTAFVSYYVDWPNNFGKFLKVAAREGVGAVTNPDLVAGLTFPAGQTWVPGEKVSLPVIVTNSGVDPATGPLTLSLFLSADASFDDPQSAPSPDLLAGTLTASVNLAQGQSQQFMFTLVVPAAAQPGPLFPIARVVAGSAINELVTANNVTVSSNSAQVVWQAGAYDGHANTALTVQDSAGIPTKFALSGAGYLEILGAGDFTTLSIHDTTAASVLTISTPGTATTSVGNIVIAGSLATLNAKNVTLRGNMTVEGTIGTIVLGNVLDDHEIDLNTTNSTLDPRLGLSITLGLVADCSLNTHGIPIKSLKTIAWSGDGTITAPWAASITIKGDAAHVISADFSPDLVLTSQNAKGVSLGSLTVPGEMSGEISAPGIVSSLKAGAWTDGALHALSAGALSFTGRKVSATLPALPGNCTADFVLNSSSAAATSIKSLVVAGTASCEIGAAGTVASVKAGAWASGSLTSSALTSFQVVADIQDLDLLVPHGAVGTLSARRWTSGSIECSTLKSLKMTGQKANLSRGLAAVPGDMAASLSAVSLTSATIAGTLSGDWRLLAIKQLSVSGNIDGLSLALNSTTSSTPTGVDLLLGNLSVAGWIRNSTLSAYGNLGTITAAGMDSSTLFAAVSSDTLPAQFDDFESAYPCLVKSFVLKGVKNVSGQYVESFINSGVAAPGFGTVSLCYAQTSNASTFGIVAHAIAKMTYKDALSVVTKSAMAIPADSLTLGNFEILIV